MAQLSKICIASLVLAFSGSCYMVPLEDVDFQAYNSFERCWQTGDQGHYKAFLVIHDYNGTQRIAEPFSAKCKLSGMQHPVETSRFVVGFSKYVPRGSERELLGDSLISNMISHVRSAPRSIIYVEGFAKHRNYGRSQQLILEPISFSKLERIDGDPGRFIADRVRSDDRP
jgi:hypothetical protein